METKEFNFSLFLVIFLYLDPLNKGYIDNENLDRIMNRQVRPVNGNMKLENQIGWTEYLKILKFDPAQYGDLNAMKRLYKVGTVTDGWYQFIMYYYNQWAKSLSSVLIKNTLSTSSRPKSSICRLKTPSSRNNSMTWTKYCKSTATPSVYSWAKEMSPKS